jgi:hypothetical protein
LIEAGEVDREHPREGEVYARFDAGLLLGLQVRILHRPAWLSRHHRVRLRGAHSLAVRGAQLPGHEPVIANQRHSQHWQRRVLRRCTRLAQPFTPDASGEVEQVAQREIALGGNAGVRAPVVDAECPSWA